MMSKIISIINKSSLFWKNVQTAFSIFITNSRYAIPKKNISLLHGYRVHLPLPELYRQCCVVLISSNVMRNIRNEVDKKFVRTKQIDCLICNISISFHNVICSILIKDCKYFYWSSKINLMKSKCFFGQFQK